MPPTTAIAAYFCTHYPHPNEISEARLLKMMYLADWRSSILFEKQISPISWKFHHYGPYSPQVAEDLIQSDGFSVRETVNLYGSKKRIFHFSGSDTVLCELSSQEISVLDFVIDSTHTKTWNEFIALVYGTYPIRTQPRFSELDLVSLAKHYKDFELGKIAANIESIT